MEDLYLKFSRRLMEQPDYGLDKLTKDLEVVAEGVAKQVNLYLLKFCKLPPYSTIRDIRLKAFNSYLTKLGLEEIE